MLNQLSIHNFAIASHVEVDFQAGMNVLTGETGAGKSILLDALGLTLGDRADTSMVRHGQDKAEISAVFDLSAHPQAQAWLEQQDLENDGQCILRRVITAEGRSRAYINGQPSPLNHLKLIGEQLIDIHSQHEHQSLLQKDKHRALLDSYAKHSPLVDEVKDRFSLWHKKSQQLEMLTNNKEESEARLHVLRYQVDELDKLALQEGEISTLEQQQNELAHAELLLSKTHEALGYADSDEGGGTTSLLSSATQCLNNLPASNPLLEEARALFEEANIQVSEAVNSLRGFAESFELDTERLSQIEERLSTAYQLARKHQCAPEELSEIHFKLATELKELSGDGQNTEQLQAEVNQFLSDYEAKAEQLSQSRKDCALKLEQQIAEQLSMLSMQNVSFVVNFETLEARQYSKHGIDRIEFLISTNPGQPPKALSKVASGGELSRISLAIQVIIAQSSTIPTMVFDEVDVGIGGGTAEVVGKLLKGLGNSGQVICVTHLAQVASQGEHHFYIGKSVEDGSTHSSITLLDTPARTEEIARMIGGITITEQTLAHAKEMLSL